MALTLQGMEEIFVGGREVSLSREEEAGKWLDTDANGDTAAGFVVVQGSALRGSEHNGARRKWYKGFRR